MYEIRETYKQITKQTSSKLQSVSPPSKNESFQESFSNDKNHVNKKYRHRDNDPTNFHKTLKSLCLHFFFLPSHDPVT